MRKKTELIIRTDNQDISISWLFVWARYKSKLTIHQMRLVIRILEFCQRDIKGIRYKDNLRQLDYLEDDVVLRMPYTDVYFSDFSLKTIRDDLKDLRGKTIEFCDFINENEVWYACGFIEKPHIYERIGLMEFKIDLKFWKQLRNLTHGIRRCELCKLLMLPTFYAMWFYMFISEQNSPKSITIEHLKERLGISENEYKDSKGHHRIDNREARIIKPAQKALTESCPYTFKYNKKRKNKDNKRSPVTSLELIPVKQPQHRDQKLEKKALLAKTSVSFLNPQVYDYLTKNMGFCLTELQPNKETLDDAIRYIPNILDKLCSLQGRRRQRDGTVKGIGWVINALKSEIEIAKKEQRAPNVLVCPGNVADLFNAEKYK